MATCSSTVRPVTRTVGLPHWLTGGRVLGILLAFGVQFALGLFIGVSSPRAELPTWHRAGVVATGVATFEVFVAARGDDEPEEQNKQYVTGESHFRMLRQVARRLSSGEAAVTLPRDVALCRSTPTGGAEWLVQRGRLYAVTSNVPCERAHQGPPTIPSL